jgi:hypothetical protein
MDTGADGASRGNFSMEEWHLLCRKFETRMMCMNLHVLDLIHRGRLVPFSGDYELLMMDGKAIAVVQQKKIVDASKLGEEKLRQGDMAMLRVLNDISFANAEANNERLCNDYEPPPSLRERRLERLERELGKLERGESSTRKSGTRPCRRGRPDEKKCST